MLWELAIFKSARLESMQGTGFDAHIVGYGMKVLQMFFFWVDSAVLAFPCLFSAPHWAAPSIKRCFWVENDSHHHTAINSYLLWQQQQTFTWSSLVCCRLGAGSGGSTKFINRQRLEVKLKIIPEMSIGDAKYVWPNYAYCLELMTGAKLVMARLMILFSGFLFVCGWFANRSQS